jgi:hypothetical protein
MRTKNVIKAYGWVVILSALLTLCFYETTLFIAVPASSSTEKLRMERPRRSDDFVDRLSVNTVLDARKNFTRYKDFEAVKRGLAYLGVRRIRDLGLRTGDIETLKRYRELAKLGIRGTVVIQPYYPVYEKEVVNDAGDVVDIVKASGKFIEAIEGPNEPQGDWKTFTYKGKPYPDNVRLFQRELYAAAKSSEVTRRIPVLAPSIFGPAPIGQVPCDIGNVHLYFGNSPPTDVPGFMVGHGRKICNKPLLDVTEAGYNFSPRNNFSLPGITPTAGYKYLLRTVFEQYNQRAIRYISLYDLLSGQSPNTVNPDYPDFAIVWSDGSPKPIATALKNSINLLKDPNSKSFNPKPLAYALAGVNHREVGHTLLQKKNGSYFLVLWQTASIFNEKTRTDMAVPDKVARLKTKRAYQFKIFDPFKGTSAIATSPTYQSEWPITLPDYPIIVELVPRP